jgi:molybdenum cofactor cytidylyltransferase
MSVIAKTTQDRGPLVGILLAAGRGSRFDASGINNKLLALVNGQAVAVQSAANLRVHVDHLIVVTKPNANVLQQAFSDLDAQLCECVDAELGMGHSLAHGVAMAQRLFAPRAVLLALADMPFIRRETFARLAALANLSALTDSGEHADRAEVPDRPEVADPAEVVNADERADLANIIAAPRFEGQRGHPVLFGHQHFAALMASRGDTGASQLLRGPNVQWVDVADAGVVRDIDRPADLLEPT